MEMHDLASNSCLVWQIERSALASLLAGSSIEPNFEDPRLRKLEFPRFDMGLALDQPYFLLICQSWTELQIFNSTISRPCNGGDPPRCHRLHIHAHRTMIKSAIVLQNLNQGMRTE
ncbi:uncharacterized protein DS421_2g45280 [Arachis hypogaea]|nr:uncharacterized protein DS421_2g45280 [Arachis hypogaea]